MVISNYSLVSVFNLSLIGVNSYVCTIWLRLLQYPSNHWQNGEWGVGWGAVLVCVCGRGVGKDVYR